MSNSQSIKCELTVIGTGIAGMASALFAANRGLSTVQVGSTGEIIFASGLLDLMGVHPIQEKKSWRDPWAGIDGLVRTILSQNTSDSNSSAAFADLKKRFPRWEMLLRARVSSIERAIRCGGLSSTKAPRIKKALQDILRSTGRLSLDFLAQMPVDDAKAWLEAIEGVGPSFPRAR